ncbi:MAG TPA: tRNA (N6-isopentenyl adenosine(37)-C2)-methylthiotransferase MiaB [Spirochaetota bacterium]|nr:tRNA (N6-isopentenyl adenosine(37)-C2)-methylthiotransferase MiaB [Spirochaetota bacterium]HOD15049.1 tRNA (N6-isopentenyl adenosine(37)-C2)-methylthiotransferase MiaB [Spirochaetota bacterium]HPG49408.1 tRNA (N6-isopentenyl adenosine(37)-C2)-methylthiotransferase MiaB [Spirochaetota bacterium]HPN12072.1 tRNA (N6-isopentenyl adenosine(37)-C2)-methylthiotransferase MiaB [Spirochaetota bacterium]
MTRTFYIETFGCQMNKNDSELMALSMTEEGFLPAAASEEADIVIFNTCSVRDHAENRALSRMRGSRKQGRSRGALLVAAGCMAQRIGGDLLKRGTADMVVGPYQVPVIGRLVQSYLADPRENTYLSQETADFTGRINPKLCRTEDTPGWHRWVTITHGCENYCSYCIVPRVRGRLISFPSAQVLDYIRGLAVTGIKEITLLGQNVNQYGTDSGDLPFYRLLEQAASIRGIERINFLTSHPKDFSDEILDVIAGHSNISRSIHLPLQSGSDRILSLMNRRYTRADYLKIVERISARLGTYSLSTDLIVGFPGETEKEFMDTLSAVETIRFDDAYNYAYSPRTGTPACALREELSRDEKIDRLQRLITLQRGISRQRLSERISSVEESIIERYSKKSGDSVMGRTYLNHVVITKGSSDDFGKRLQIRIDSVQGTTLQGTRIA